MDKSIELLVATRARAAQEAGDECATPGTPLSRRVLDALGFG